MSEPQSSVAHIRCKACMARFDVTYPRGEAVCPGCGQGWRIKWFKKGVGMIIAPTDWTRFQKASRKGAPEAS